MTLSEAEANYAQCNQAARDGYLAICRAEAEYRKLLDAEAVALRLFLRIRRCADEKKFRTPEEKC